MKRGFQYSLFTQGLFFFPSCTLSNLTGQRDQVWMLRFTGVMADVLCRFPLAKDVALLLDDEVAKLYGFKRVSYDLSPK